MKLLVRYQNIAEASHARCEQMLTESTAHYLKRHLKRFLAERVLLRADLAMDAAHPSCHVRLRLALPRGTLVSAEDGKSIRSALRASFVDLERQIERHLARLRREDIWRRKQRREGLRRLKAATAAATPAESARFDEQVRALLSPLQRFAQRELSYLRARGDLAETDPALDDVVDEVLTRALERLNQAPQVVLSEDELHGLALAVLEAEVARRRSEEGRWVSLEAKATVVPARSHDDIDDAVFEYWQPDELLRMEDVVPDAAISPDEVAAQNEMHEIVGELLSQLPNQWRRTVLLARVDDVPVRNIARLLNTPEGEVRSWLDHADAFLKARLEEDGLQPVSGTGQKRHGRASGGTETEGQLPDT